MAERESGAEHQGSEGIEEIREKAAALIARADQARQDRASLITSKVADQEALRASSRQAHADHQEAQDRLQAIEAIDQTFLTDADRTEISTLRTLATDLAEQAQAIEARINAISQDPGVMATLEQSAEHENLTREMEQQIVKLRQESRARATTFSEGLLYDAQEAHTLQATFEKFDTNKDLKRAKDLVSYFQRQLDHLRNNLSVTLLPNNLKDFTPETFALLESEKKRLPFLGKGREKKFLSEVLEKKDVILSGAALAGEYDTAKQRFFSLQEGTPAMRDEFFAILSIDQKAHDVERELNKHEEQIPAGARIMRHYGQFGEDGRQTIQTFMRDLSKKKLPRSTIGGAERLWSTIEALGYNQGALKEWRERHPENA